MEHPQDWDAFERRFATEEDCIGYLAALRWPHGFRCPLCGSADHALRGLGLMECRACRRRTSVTAGTLFEGTRLGLRRWFLATWILLQHGAGMSALDLQRLLGLRSYETAWTWLHKLRRAMAPDGEPLRGQIELGEVRLGGAIPVFDRPAGRHRIAIAVERVGPGIGAGRVRMRRLEDGRRATVVRFVEEAVAPGAIVLTGARQLALAGHPGYRHIPLEPGERALPAAHRVGVLLERWLLGTHQGTVSAGHLDHYLDEWCFRFAARHERDRGRLFHELLVRAVHTPPQPYASLVKRR